jgi:hypothetical protein
MPNSVPTSTPGDDSANAAEGTQLADTAATPEGWIDVPGEPGALRRLKPGDRFKIGDVECAVVPIESTHAMRQAGYEQACYHPSLVWDAMIEAVTAE